VTVEVHAVTPDRWDDLCALAGDRGFYSGCWCMWWRVTSTEFQRKAGNGLKAQLQRLVAEGREPGLLAYRNREPVGWVAVSPRSELGRIERSPKLKPIDDEPAWAISCFYIHRRHRRSGVARALLEGATAFARSRGAAVVEGYPIDTTGGRKESAALYTGTLTMFESAGFVEVARRGGRPIVRS